MCDLLGFLSLKTDSWVVLLQRLDRNFQNDDFEYLTREIALHFQDLWLLCLASQKSHVDPATQVHSIPKTTFFWVHVRFLWCKTDLSQKIECIVFGKVFRKLYLKVFGPAILDCRTQKSFFKHKILKEITWLLLKYCHNVCESLPFSMSGNTFPENRPIVLKKL